MFFRKFQASLAVCLLALLGSQDALSKSPPTENSSLVSYAVPSPTQSMGLSELRKQLETYLQAATQATKELQAGHHKLKRICDLGRGATLPKELSPPDFTSPTGQARLDLMGLETSLQQVLKSYTQNSRITQLSACRYVPSFVPLAFACEGFRQDSAKLETAEYANQKLIGEARKRLDLYDQFRSLESRGCTRTGFNKTLWDTEQTYLWPTLLLYPEFLSNVLRTTTPN